LFIGFARFFFNMSECRVLGPRNTKAKGNHCQSQVRDTHDLIRRFNFWFVIATVLNCMDGTDVSEIQLFMLFYFISDSSLPLYLYIWNGWVRDSGFICVSVVLYFSLCFLVRTWSCS